MGVGVEVGSSHRSAHSQAQAVGGGRWQLPPTLHIGETSAGAICLSPTVSPSLTPTPALGSALSLGRPWVSH